MTSFWDLAKGIGFRVAGIRLLLTLLLLFALFELIPELSGPGYYYYLLVSYVLTLIISAMVYGWGGWKATRLGYTLADAAKLGLITGLIVGAVTGAVEGNFNFAGFLFNLVVEAIFATVCTLIGAAAAAKVRIT